MSTRYAADAVLPEAAKIIDTWTANPDFKLGTLTLVDFTKKRDEAASANAIVETKRTDLSGLMNARDDKLGALHDLTTRARSGFKATYGADSSQYEQSGGTRTSERKPPDAQGEGDGLTATCPATPGRQFHDEQPRHVPDNGSMG